MEGRIIAGRYRLGSLIGRGGGGSVWRAVHLGLSTPAAVKLIDTTGPSSADTLVRFKREAKAAASLRSRNVVQILDYGVDEGVPYIAMELLEGESLAARLATRGRLSATDTAEILRQVGHALELAHQKGIVHRDLKPDNVFLARDGTEETVKVLDFGIAKANAEQAAVDELRTQTGTVLGTPAYMSLEQLIGDKAVDHRTDVWALAVLAFECLTGRRPFLADTLGALVLLLSSGPLPVPSRVASVPVGFDEWFSRCTARDVEQRCASIGAAASEFASLVESGRFTPEPLDPAPDAALPRDWGASLLEGSAPPTVPQGPLRKVSTDGALVTSPARAPRKTPTALLLGLGVFTAVAAAVVASRGLVRGGAVGEGRHLADATAPASAPGGDASAARPPPVVETARLVSGGPSPSVSARPPKPASSLAASATPTHSERTDPRALAAWDARAPTPPRVAGAPAVPPIRETTTPSASPPPASSTRPDVEGARESARARVGF